MVLFFRRLNIHSPANAIIQLMKILAPIAREASVLLFERKIALIMKPRPLATLLLCAAFSFGTATAAPLNMLGLPDMSCPAWLKSKDDPDQRASYIVWLRGFLSGHNYALQGQQVASISSGTIEMYVNRYCSKNATGLVSDAGQRLSDEFSGRNQPIRK